MRLTKTSAQAVMAMAFLARQSGGPLVQARQVAAYLDIPTDSALKVLQVLARQKLIDSQLGRTGGYQLTRSADDVTVLDVVEAIEGPFRGFTSLVSPPEHTTVVAAKLQTLCERVSDCIREE